MARKVLILSLPRPNPVLLCPFLSYRDFITQEGNRLEVAPRPPVALTNTVSWRSEGIKHRKNEIFLDVIEKLNLLVSSNGTVLHSEIVGAIRMKSFLSGMPELKLGLNDKLMFEATGRPVSKGKAVELEDIKFHQCVRLARSGATPLVVYWTQPLSYSIKHVSRLTPPLCAAADRFENDRTISFIPPDGEFDLMTYRLSTHVKPLIWVEAVVEPHSHSRIEYMIKVRAALTLSALLVLTLWRLPTESETLTVFVRAFRRRASSSRDRSPTMSISSSQSRQTSTLPASRRQ